MGSRFPTQLGYVLSWFALSAMVAITALQVHALVMLAGYYIVNTPALRPAGWSSTTLAGISSMGYLVLGAISLGVITYVEQDLRTAAGEGRLRRQATRLAAVIGGIWLVTVILRFAALSALT